MAAPANTAGTVSRRRGPAVPCPRERWSASNEEDTLSDIYVSTYIYLDDMTRVTCDVDSDPADGGAVMGFGERKVVPLGMGHAAPPEPEAEPLPPACVEVVVFVPRK